MTDASGQWREVVALDSSGVNSVAVREAVEGVIARAPVKPTVIRFFRRQMLNMLTIALGGVASARPTLRVAPSRATHALREAARTSKRGRSMDGSRRRRGRDVDVQLRRRRGGDDAAAATRIVL